MLSGGVFKNRKYCIKNLLVLDHKMSYRVLELNEITKEY